METKKVEVDKNNKYDRQLRLWGDHGQSALESARVCLINATATGTEILKNLILPGIGSFTVVDGNKVQGEDAGNNFFLTKDSIGHSRAKIATELLSELNDDVSGDFVEEHPETLLETNRNFFSQFTLVIATNVCERTLLKLASKLWEINVPLLVCRCYGFIGYMRLVVREHTVIESHPDSTHEDLRLDRPFPGLVKFADSLNMETMNKKDHSHTPWLIILYKYLQIWKAQHNGEPPKNYREKNQLKELIREGVRRNEEGILEDEENFDEAVKSVNTALVPTRIPSDVESLFNDHECVNLHAESSNFWVLVRAVKEFSNNEGNGALPVRGTIPDMTADSDRYIQLQQVYREQADRDDAIVTQKVHDLLQSIGRAAHKSNEDSGESAHMCRLIRFFDACIHKEEPLFPERLTSLSQCHNSAIQKGCHIPEQEIKTFCKNAAFVRLVRCRSLEEEYSNKSTKLQEIAQSLEDEEPNDVVFYILLRAVDRFFEEYNIYPGYYTQQVEADVNKLKGCVSKMLHDWGLSSSVKDDFIHEMCRYGAAELHTLSAFIGGVAAQEAIKVITQQFIPFNNTYIYNAMKQTSVTIEA